MKKKLNDHWVYEMSILKKIIIAIEWYHFHHHRKEQEKKQIIINFDLRIEKKIENKKPKIDSFIHELNRLESKKECSLFF